jgi:hypothetical protein
VKDFQNGRWYSFLLRVTVDRIQASIDGELLIDVYIGNRVVGLRPGEIELSRPLGFATYGTVGAIRKIEYRVLPPAAPAR